MNCQLCQEKLDAYLEGTLPSDMKTQVDSHLNGCKTCKHFYNILFLADRVIDSEKKLEPDPFLVTRVMAKIENKETSVSENLFIKILRPVLITSSLAAAILFGVMLGNLSLPENNIRAIPAELAMINDASLESIDNLSQE
ncbi:MAG TPA: zf-HC2 domain-containing protein [Bacteroidales bacterium]|nr:zf-HC2 domain-containing protein [Bacteroidales bacterium]